MERTVLSPKLSLTAGTHYILQFVLTLPAGSVDLKQLAGQMATFGFPVSFLKEVEVSGITAPLHAYEGIIEPVDGRHTAETIRLALGAKAAQVFPLTELVPEPIAEFLYEASDLFFQSEPGKYGVYYRGSTVYFSPTDALPDDAWMLAMVWYSGAPESVQTTKNKLSELGVDVVGPHVPSDFVPFLTVKMPANARCFFIRVNAEFARGWTPQALAEMLGVHAIVVGREPVDDFMVWVINKSDNGMKSLEGTIDEIARTTADTSASLFETLKQTLDALTKTFSFLPTMIKVVGGFAIVGVGAWALYMIGKPLAATASRQRARWK